MKDVALAIGQQNIHLLIFGVSYPKNQGILFN